VNTLVLKVVLTPALIGAASLAGRRWGAAVSGWLVGLPFTSAPIIFILALTQGASFAATTATGTLAGGVSQVAFCLAYGWLAWRSRWPMALLGGSLAFAGVTVVLHGIVFDAPMLLFLGVLVVLTVALRLMPREVRAGSAQDTIAALPTPHAAATSAATPPWWDLPARMAIATGLVLLLTGVAPLLGPQLTGLLAPFPTYAAILAVFAQRQQGPAAAVSVLRGLQLGLYAFAAFFVVVAMLLTHLGIAFTFVIAIVSALVVQAGSLGIVRRARS
jgi:hypothetical protein